MVSGIKDLEGRKRLLEVKDLHVDFPMRQGTVRALRGVDLNVGTGETLALVGESGCGKSMTARAIMNMVPPPGRITKGTVLLHKGDEANITSETLELTSLNPKGRRIREIRGKDIAMIFQEPMSSLSPVHSIQNQIIETILLHQNVSRKEARRHAHDMLSLVGLPADKRLSSYPFELSGGMRQRAMIAMALSCKPKLLIADEPTTALDVTIQAQILKLLQRLQQELHMAVLMITHNLGIVASLARRVAVMYLGSIVEEGSIEEVFKCPSHPYTRGLLDSVPQLGTRKHRLTAIAGTVPQSFVQLQGCAFHPRCPERVDGLCDKEVPAMVRVGEGHFAKCFQHQTSEMCQTRGSAEHAGTVGE